MAPSATMKIAPTNGSDVLEEDKGKSLKATSGGYTKKTPQEKAKLIYERAVDMIRANLPRMTPLKALLEIDMVGGDGPLYLDARHEPKLVATAEGQPDCQLKIKPEYIIQFTEGKLEPRYGLFKDAFFDDSTLPKGRIHVAVKFADYLTPINVAHPIIPEGIELPKPTEDLDQVRADLRKFGYGLVKDALSPEHVERMREAVRQQATGESKAGVAARDGGPNTPNQRIWSLINKGQEFHDLLEHELIDKIVPDFLGEHTLIHSYSANIARPGNAPMVLHTDQVAIQPPIRSLAFGLNIMWYLTDVTADNGATRVFPGSHIGDIAPDDPFSIEGTIPAEGPAGTALVFESRLWHATGPNKQTSGERPVILMFFMRSFIRQQENNFLSIRPEVEATMTDRVRKMLGYQSTGALGGVEGKVMEGIWVSRVENPVGPFRDTHTGTPYRQTLRDTATA